MSIRDSTPSLSYPLRFPMESVTPDAGTPLPLRTTNASCGLFASKSHVANICASGNVNVGGSLLRPLAAPSSLPFPLVGTPDADEFQGALIPVP
jgi:hypothetical protein